MFQAIKTIIGIEDILDEKVIAIISREHKEFFKFFIKYNTISRAVKLTNTTKKLKTLI